MSDTVVISITVVLVIILGGVALTRIVLWYIRRRPVVHILEDDVKKSSKKRRLSDPQLTTNLLSNDVARLCGESSAEKYRSDNVIRRETEREELWIRAQVTVGEELAERRKRQAKEHALLKERVDEAQRRLNAIEKEREIEKERRRKEAERMAEENRKMLEEIRETDNGIECLMKDEKEIEKETDRLQTEIEDPPATVHKPGFFSRLKRTPQVREQVAEEQLEPFDNVVAEEVEVPRQKIADEFANMRIQKDAEGVERMRREEGMVKWNLMRKKFRRGSAAAMMQDMLRTAPWKTA